MRRRYFTHLPPNLIKNQRRVFLNEPRDKFYVNTSSIENLLIVCTLYLKKTYGQLKMSNKV